MMSTVTPELLLPVYYLRLNMMVGVFGEPTPALTGLFADQACKVFSASEIPASGVDLVYAQGYLSASPDEQIALSKLADALLPGGRLVIVEKSDKLSTERLVSLLKSAGLVNRIVTGETGENGETNLVAIAARKVSGVLQAVKAGYTAAALAAGGCCEPQTATTTHTSSSAGGGCCSPSLGLPEDFAIAPELKLIATDPEKITFTRNYSRGELSEAPKEAGDFSLGCGNPLAMAALVSGETVLDIGSGGGLDSLIASNRVGSQGKVIGVDMTPAMLERARKSAAKGGYQNVEFRYGFADALPAPDGSVDVVLSNCVINLTEDKGAVFAEAYRVLRPGGRLEVSDVVTDRPYLPSDLADPAGWPGCVTGALPLEEYLALIRIAGFKDAYVRTSTYTGEQNGLHVMSAVITAKK